MLVLLSEYRVEWLLSVTDALHEVQVTVDVRLLKKDKERHLKEKKTHQLGIGSLLKFQVRHPGSISRMIRPRKHSVPPLQGFDATMNPSSRVTAK